MAVPLLPFGLKCQKHEHPVPHSPLPRGYTETHNWKGHFIPEGRYDFHLDIQGLN